MSESEGTPLPANPLDWEGDAQRWPAAAPSLKPHGLILLESSITYAGHDEDDDEDERTFDWVISGHPAHATSEGDDWSTALVGELFVCREALHLVVAAVLPLRARFDVFTECATAGEVEDRFAYWASDLLWDFIAAEGNRQLVSMRASFVVPAETPRPRLTGAVPPASDSPTGAVKAPS